MKASEVLQASIDDIDAGKWVCGLLHEKDYNKGPNGTEMGCAVGLVSINSGDTKTVKVTRRDLPEWMEDNLKENLDYQVGINRSSGASGGASCNIRKPGIKVGDTFEVARYPKPSSPQETKDAIKYLDAEIPEDYKSTFHGNNLQRQVNNVVRYNDGKMETLGAKAAKKWFSAARDKALADGN